MVSLHTICTLINYKRHIGWVGRKAIGLGMAKGRISFWVISAWQPLWLSAAMLSGQSIRTTPRRPSRKACRSPSAQVSKADFPVYLHRTWNRAGFQHRHGANPRGRTDRHQSTSRKASSSRTGDLIAQIDPRPFQAALDQAIAKKNQDEASLGNAKLDLQRSTKLGDICDEADCRYADRERSADHGATRGRRRGDLQCTNPARLREHQGAHLRRDRHPSGRRRQHRQRGDADRHRHHRADRADLRDLHRT